VLQPAFRAPVEAFATPPADAPDLAQRMERYQRPVHTLSATLRVTARGGNVRGKQRFTLLMLYREPDKVKFKVTGAIVGALFQVAVQGEEAAVYLQKEGRFYRGLVAELEANPRALNGVRPVDIVRALLVTQEAASSLRKMPAGQGLAESDAHWALSGGGSAARPEVFMIRRDDGLVEQVSVYDRRRFTETSPPYVRVTYHRYKYYGQTLLPSRFELAFADTGLHLQVELEQATPNGDLPESRFSLDPPKELAGRVEPLSAWLRRLRD